MPARFELIGKHAATITAIDILCLKMGQTDVQPAVCLSIKVALPNSKLSMLDPTLQRFLYEKDGPASPNTNTLAGIEPVSDLPDLTAAAKAIGAMGWEYEQTGCKLKIYSGATGHANLTLKDGTVRKLKLDPQQGGTVDHVFQFYTADVDAETIGELGVLKSLERDIELTAPEIISQQTTIEEAGDEVQTPERALQKELEKDQVEGGEQPTNEHNPNPAWPFPTSGHDPAKDVKVTTKRSRKAGAPAN
jgi:hypothetical protein